MNHFAKFITNQRKERGLSLREFAKICNLSHSYLDAIEKGKDPRTGKSFCLTIDTLIKISKGLNIPIRKIIDIVLKDFNL